MDTLAQQAALSQIFLLLIQSMLQGKKLLPRKQICSFQGRSLSCSCSMYIKANRNSLMLSPFGKWWKPSVSILLKRINDEDGDDCADYDGDDDWGKQFQWRWWKCCSKILYEELQLPLWRIPLPARLKPVTTWVKITIRDWNCEIFESSSRSTENCAG